MVKYYGRARQRIGSVNTNYQGQKMSGNGQSIGSFGAIRNYIKRRVNQKGLCRPPMQNGTIWRETYLTKNSLYNNNKAQITNKFKLPNTIKTPPKY